MNFRLAWATAALTVGPVFASGPSHLTVERMTAPIGTDTVARLPDGSVQEACPGGQVLTCDFKVGETGPEMSKSR